MTIAASTDKPAISFCLFAYNQEMCIREAVLGALSQNFMPLVVILSDDCSTDNTFAIIQEIANAYTGPHRIILNRNSSNKGIVPHLNDIFFRYVKTDLLIVAAGDDISCPDRTLRLWNAWQASYPKPMMVSSGLDYIDSESRVVGGWQPSTVGAQPGFSFDAILNPNGNMRGAAAMYHRSIFDFFGPLAIAQVEDGPLAIRSRILGPVIALPDKLVQYRLTTTSMSQSKVYDYKSKAARGHAWRLSIYDQAMYDLTTYRRATTGFSDYDKYVVNCKAYKQRHVYYLEMLNADSLLSRIYVFSKLVKGSSGAEIINNIIYLFPDYMNVWVMKFGLPAESRLWKALSRMWRRIRGERRPHKV